MSCWAEVCWNSRSYSRCLFSTGIGTDIQRTPGFRSAQEEYFQVDFIHCAYNLTFKALLLLYLLLLLSGAIMDCIMNGGNPEVLVMSSKLHDDHNGN
jgi:hypothetical protein